jgi:predicted amidohydrolase
MRICLAQTIPYKGDIDKNIEQHKTLIDLAIQNKANIIVFPELSLTGYEPQLAKELATTQNDTRLEVFQNISNLSLIVICVGIPTKVNNQLFISMIVFQPNKERLTYSKQYLYPSEIGIFTPGTKQVFIDFENNNKIAPAICYELSVPDHSGNAIKSGANMYIASVLNSVSGVDNDLNRLSDIAKKHMIITGMANFAGQSGGYQCAGKTSFWNKHGELSGQLNDNGIGIIIFDINTEEILTELI